ncbi:hypothetical protein NIA71_05335 [Ihubacter massiliensis]|uniref:Uncharacterized protein n=1 Tax=Hominibacterium faecale TaxID=2839743 RepID=A0A9J6QLK5_9FIRM|nr:MULTISPECIES: hypothetical protein [Eubacteriales Family XIII. Incertae Sedis]MCO7121374.1 hypothetical protein [Ihubacter massiliensis]MCU7378360.1 hypothetical protein [Hominibacterium faecale]
MIDILKKIQLEPDNLESIEMLIDEQIEAWHNDPKLQIDLAKMLGMNEYEWTAYGQGIDLKLLAGWRQKGWPTKCALCNEPLDYKSFGWFIIEGRKLVHIKCL